MAGMVGPSRSVQTKSLKPKVTVSSIFVKVVGKTKGHIYLQIKSGRCFKGFAKIKNKKVLV